MVLFIIEVLRGFKNIEVASSPSTEMYVYVCVARITCAADQPTNRGAGRSRGRGDSDDEAPFLSYGDHDVPNVLPSFDSSRVGFQLPGYYASLCKGLPNYSLKLFLIIFLKIKYLMT